MDIAKKIAEELEIKVTQEHALCLRRLNSIKLVDLMKHLK